jgi:hypothetical protein
MLMNLHNRPMLLAERMSDSGPSLVTVKKKKFHLEF